MGRFERIFATCVGTEVLKYNELLRVLNRNDTGEQTTTSDEVRWRKCRTSGFRVRRYDALHRRVTSSPGVGGGIEQLLLIASYHPIYSWP